MIFTDLASRFVVEDEKHNYVSGRFPPDAELLAKKAVEMVNNVLNAEYVAMMAPDSLEGQSAKS